MNSALIDMVREKSITAENGCVIWTGATTQRGYPILMAEACTFGVRRLVIEHALGKLSPRAVVIATCGNRLCVNAEHLVTGTYKEAYRYSIQHGKAENVKHFGVKNGQAKLNPEKVRLIRERKKNGVTRSVLARELEVCEQAIQDVWSGRTWGHVL